MSRKHKTPGETGDEKVRSNRRNYEPQPDSAESFGSNDAMLKYAGNITFEGRIGLPFELASGAPNVGSVSVGTARYPKASGVEQTFPGIMVLPLLCGPGISRTSFSAVNLASEKIYGRIRREINKISDYDKTDVMVQLLCLDSLVYMYEYGLRAYKTANTYNSTNAYYGKRLVRAQGFDPEEMATNIGMMKYHLQQLAIRIREEFFIPFDIPLFKRHRDYFSYAISDSSVLKSQVYLFVPRGYYTWDDTGVNGSRAVFHSMSQYTNLEIDAPFTTESYFQLMQDMLDKIVNSSSFSNINGDLSKAYGGITLDVEEATDDSILTVYYSEKILNQIQNATIYPWTNPDYITASWNVDQNVTKNVINYEPNFYAGDYPTIEISKQVVSSLDDHPDSSKVVDITRLTITGHYAVMDGSVVTSYITPSAAGPEILTGMFIWDLNAAGNFTCNVFNSATYVNLGPSVTTISLDALYVPSRLEKFDWHPKLAIGQQSASPDNIGWYTLKKYLTFWDVQNYAIVDEVTLGVIHDNAILGQFGITGAGTL